MKVVIHRQFVDVFLGDETLDDRGARGGRAEAALAHGLAQAVVVHELAGAFHGAEQGGFREARRRLGLAGLHLHVRPHEEGELPGGGWRRSAAQAP